MKRRHGGTGARRKDRGAVVPISPKQETRFRDFVRAYGKAVPPAELWQQSLDGAEDAYPRLIALAKSLPESDEPRVEDVHNYAIDLFSMPVQPELFACVLPVCFHAWHHDVAWGGRKYGGAIEQFSPALARRPLIDEFLSKKQAHAVKTFMRDAILDRLDVENSLSHAGMGAPVYGWFEKFGSFCVIVPELEPLWSEWWAFGTPGRAVAALQYISCLMYEDDENPIFATWNPDKGGGPPCLWGTDGHIYEECWKPENVRFFRDTVTVNYVFDALKRASKALNGVLESSVPGQMIEDFSYLDDVLVHRIRALTEIVSRPLFDSPMDWPPPPPS